jgi:myosin-1
MPNQRPVAPPKPKKTPAPPPKPKKSPTCKALFDFEGADAGELPLKAGDVITILKKREDGWWEGRTKGKSGIFPGNYVSEE